MPQNALAVAANDALDGWQVLVGDTLTLRVTPKASANRIEAERRPDGGLTLRVHVTAAPENGKANAAVLKLLAKALGVPKSTLAVTAGWTGRDKTVRVAR